MMMEKKMESLVFINALLESFGKDTTIEQLLEKLDDSIIVKVNGKDIWNEAFLQELD